MNTINTDLINQGAAVKGAPGTNAAALILQAESVPLTMPDTALVTPIVPITETASPVQTLPNVLPIQEKPSNAGPVILAAAGLGAIWLLTDGKQKTMSGPKNKERKKKSSMLPVLLIGGAAAAYLYFKNSSTPADGTAPTTPAATNDNTTPAQTGFVFTPIQVPTTDAAIHNALYNYSVPWRYAVDRMTPDERKTLYLYVYGYIERHIHLYNFPGVFPDGIYDPALYAAVLAVSNKWNLQLLY